MPVKKFTAPDPSEFSTQTCSSTRKRRGRGRFGMLQAVSVGFNPIATRLGAGGVCSPAAHLEGLRDVAEALFQLAPGSLQLLQLQPAHGKHALPERERWQRSGAAPPPPPLRSRASIPRARPSLAASPGWGHPPGGQSQAGPCPLLTQVMAGPAGSVTGSYISRSFLRTSALMGCISGKPSRTTSACFTGSPGDRPGQTGSSSQISQAFEPADEKQSSEAGKPPRAQLCALQQQRGLFFCHSQV